MHFDKEEYELIKFLICLKNMYYAVDFIQVELVALDRSLLYITLFGDDDDGDALHSMLNEIHKLNTIAEIVVQEMVSEENMLSCKKTCDSIWSVLGKENEKYKDIENFVDLNMIKKDIDHIMTIVEMGIKRVNSRFIRSNKG